MKLSDLGNISKEDVREMLGLQKGQSATERWIERLSSFGVGFLLGAGISLLFAPKSGQELRESLGERIRGLQSDDNEESPAKKSTEPVASPSEYSR